MEKEDLIPTLSAMYSESFGEAGLWIFLLGAFAVLYSTIFISTASNSRLSVDALHLFGVIDIDDTVKRQSWIRIACIGLPALYFIFFLTIGDPVALVLTGAIAQALMLPFLCFGALYFLYRDTDIELRPGKLWVVMLWISSGLMTSVGIYQLLKTLGIDQF